MFEFDRKNVLTMSVLGLFLMSIIAAVLSAVNYYVVSVEKEIEEKYGKSIINVQSDDRELLAAIEGEPYVKNAYECYADFCDGEALNEYYNVYCASAELLTQSAIQLVDGKYPQNEGEIAVDGRLCSRCGVPTNRPVGSEIILPLDGKTYTITGVVKSNAIEYDGLSDEYLVLLPTVEKVNCVFLEITELRKVWDIVREISEKYPDSSLRGTLQAFSMLMINDKQTIYDIADIIGMTMTLITIVVASVMVLLFTRLLLIRNARNMAILRMLGVRNKDICTALILFQMVFFSIGGIVGIAVGEVCGASLYRGSGFSFTGYLLHTPWRSIMLCFLLCIACSVVMLVWRAFRQSGISANETNRRVETSKIRDVFRRTGHGYRGRIIRKQLHVHRTLNVLVVTGFFLASTLMILVFYGADLNSQGASAIKNRPDVMLSNASQYIPDEDEGIASDRMNSILDKLPENTRAIRYFETACRTFLREESLGDDLADHYRQMPSHRISLKTSRKIEVVVSVVPYTDEVQGEAIRNTGLKSLGEGEAWVYRYGMVSEAVRLKNNIRVGDKYELSRDNHGEEGKFSLEVTGILSDPPVVAEYGYGELMFIISQEWFDRLFPEEKPLAVFLYSDDEIPDTLIRQIAADETVAVTKPKEDNRERQHQMLQLRKITAAMSGVVALMSLLLIAGNMFINANAGEKEYCTYYAIGETPFGIAILIAGHGTVLCGIGVVLSLVSSAYITRFMFVKAFGPKSAMYYHFPFRPAMVSVGMIVLCFGVTVIPVYLAYRRKRIVDVLKA